MTNYQRREELREILSGLAEAHEITDYEAALLCCSKEELDLLYPPPMSAYMSHVLGSTQEELSGFYPDEFQVV